MKKFTNPPLLLLLFVATNVSAQFAKVPVKLTENGHLLLQVQINDSKENHIFLFDTGASQGVIDKSVAKKMGLNVVSQQKVPGVGGVQTYDILSEQELNLSDYLFLSYDYMVSADLSRFHELLDDRYDGILGFTLLWEFITKIDYEKQELVLYEKINEVNLEGYQVIPFDFHNGIRIPQFDVSFTTTNGEKFKGRILLDTGAAQTLSVNTPFSKENRLLAKANKSLQSKSQGLGTTTFSEEIAIKSIEVGGFTFDDLPITLTDDKAGVNSYKGYLGILGTDVIKRFDVVLDYQSKKLYLKPNKFYNDSFEFPLSSIRLKKKNNQIIVDMLSDKSPAYKAGLRQGDIILSMNGASYDTLLAYKKLLKKEGNSMITKVKTKSGETKTYTFKLQRLL